MFPLQARVDARWLEVAPDLGLRLTPNGIAEILPAMRERTAAAPSRVG